jgi:hypothetical protein
MICPDPPSFFGTFESLRSYNGLKQLDEPTDHRVNFLLTIYIPGGIFDGSTME